MSRQTFKKKIIHKEISENEYIHSIKKNRPEEDKKDFHIREFAHRKINSWVIPSEILE